MGSIPLIVTTLLSRSLRAGHGHEMTAAGTTRRTMLDKLRLGPHHRSFFAMMVVLALSMVPPSVSVTANDSEDPPLKLGSAPLNPGRLFNGPAPEAALTSLAHIETSEDLVTAVVTYTVTTRAVADEEWRAKFGGGTWVAAANTRIEAADDAMFANWGIDFVVKEYANWDSRDPARPLCIGTDTIYQEFAGEVGLNGWDVATGFTANPSTRDAGCTLNSKVLVLFQDPSSDWKVTRHEYSHLYGADDVPNNTPDHPDDIMEGVQLYSHPDFWCNKLPWAHFSTITSQADKYN